MNFSYHPRGTFSALNEKLAEVLKVPLDKNQSRAYPNASFAISEIAISYFQTFSMKKKFYYFKELDPHFELAVTALSKLGFEGKALTLEQFSQDLSWTEGLDRESGIVFWSEDHPLTGQIYDTTELLKKVGEKNTFRIRLSHSKHLSEDLVPTAERNEARIFQMPSEYLDGCAVAILGERARLGAVTAEALSPTSFEKIEELGRAVTEKKVLARPLDYEAVKAKIEKFEQTKIEGLKFFFSHAPRLLAPEVNRVYDRTVFWFEDMDGLAFIEQLAEELKLSQTAKLTPVLAQNRVSADWLLNTTSLSKWGGLRTMKWLEAQGMSPNQIRGLCAVDASLIDSEFSAKFVTSREKVLKAQNGH